MAPAMIRAGLGVTIVTGNTSAFRGKANFAGFAPTKAAQRILAESIARDLGPLGVHVAYLTIDAVIDLAWTRATFAAPRMAFCTLIRCRAAAIHSLNVMSGAMPALREQAICRPRTARQCAYLPLFVAIAPGLLLLPNSASRKFAFDCACAISVLSAVN
jgi:NAD(P)-dependent dehydrogenase (short-subunit alcohol dehydrogenase family)